MNAPKLRFSEFDREWDIAPLNELINIKSEKFNPVTSDKNLKCIELEHIESNSGRLLGSTESKRQASIKNRFQPGDVLFGKLRPYLKKFWYAQFNGVCSTEIWVINSSILENRFLYAFIQADHFNSLANLSSGSKMPRSDWDAMKSEFFSYPDTQEQTKIGNLFALLDNMLHKQQEKINLIEQYKKGMIQKIFSLEIRFKDEYENEYPEWEKFYLKDLCTDFIVPMRDKPKDLSGNIPWCRIEDIDGKYIHGTKSNQFVSNKTIASMNLKINPVGTVISSCSASLGVNAITTVPLITNQTFIGLVCGRLLYNEYLYYYLINITKHLKSIAGGTTIPYISREKYEQIYDAFPSYAEQVKIANFLSKIDEKYFKEKEKLEVLKNFKKGLLQQMFI